MDSGNSGSMQSSSSNGDEEYDHDLRAESISAFFNNTSTSNNPTSHVGPMPNPPRQPPLPSTSLYHDSLFTNFFDNQSLPKSPQNTNSFVNLDTLWSRNLRSDPNCSDLGAFMAASSSSAQQQNQPPFQTMRAGTTIQENVQRGVVSASNEQNSNVGRNTKKRSRASRRAPTTVLTTDTNNFRAMVQEFTGIPAPPFGSRNRFDLFGSASALRPGLGHFDHVASHSSSHLLRPFAQKLQPSSSSLFSSYKADAITSTTVTSTTASNNNISSTNSSHLGYQMPYDLGLLRQQNSQNLVNTTMQNHVLDFQSFLQGPPRYPLSGTSILGFKHSQGSSSSGMQTSDHHLQLKNIGTLEDNFGTSIHGQVHPNNLGELQNIVSSRGWGGVEVTNNGNKLHGSASSDVHGDNRGPENVAPRSEGMMEAWICSSD